MKTTTIDSEPLIDSWRSQFEELLENCLPKANSSPTRLHQAMRYSVLAGGKRIRPLLVYASTHAQKLPFNSLNDLARALELIHAYSLIHDDLPAMDDDDWRRGRATCHLAFDEATAILAGDALQALAFERLASIQSSDSTISLELIQRLAKACGSHGMAGGQMLDLEANGTEINLASLEQIHNLKTGALISLSVVGPAVFSRASKAEIHALEEFGYCVGLGFQIRDDILDVTGETAKTGKSTQADAARNQPTFPALIGLEASQERAEELMARAIKALGELSGDTAPLAWLAKYIIQRDH